MNKKRNGKGKQKRMYSGRIWYCKESERGRMYTNELQSTKWKRKKKSRKWERKEKRNEEEK